MPNRLFIGNCFIILLAVVLVASGCSGAKEGEEKRVRTPRRVLALDTPNEYVVSGLRSANPAVKSAQLFREPNETNLPVIALGTGDRLTLRFDLVGEQRRPLSVYFYHANRRWTRDLSASQILTSFQRDEILDYEESRATEIEYVHYDYSFPNASIDFRVSGNYIVRVTEQGFENDVILERAFYVTEQLTPVELGLTSILQSNSPYQAVQPIAIFTPPDGLQTNVFGYAVCFMQNGRTGAVRCTDEPAMARMPALEFYLRPQSAFERSGSEYFLDVSSLQIGGMIEHSDLTVSPFEVVLQPDFSQLGGGDLYPLLNGQSEIESAVQNVTTPGIEAEYVRVFFALVPKGEQPVGGDVHVIGSFNNWQALPENRLTWYPDQGRYEGAIMLKQGRYEYRYVSRTGNQLRDVTEGFPRLDYLYTSFVYYNDALLQTDRLISIGSARTRD